MKLPDKRRLRPNKIAEEIRIRLSEKERLRTKSPINSLNEFCN